MDEQFCVVPYWGIPSPEADNLLSDFYTSHYDNSVSKTVCGCPNNDSKLSTGRLSSRDLEHVLEQTISTSAAVHNDEGRLLCSLSDENDGPSYYDAGDISWLNEFMNVYGVTTLDSCDDFNMKNTSVTVVSTPQAKEDHRAIVTTHMQEMNNSYKVLANECVKQPSPVPDSVSMMSADVCTAANASFLSVAKANTAQKTGSLVADNDKTTNVEAVMVVHSNIHQESSTVPASDHSQKFTVNSTGFKDSSERKREQNRCAAIRYRGKRREEAKQMKQELHELESHNIKLKAEINWLEREVVYLKGLMKLTKSF